MCTFYYYLPNHLLKNSSTCCLGVKNQMGIMPRINRCIMQKCFKQYTARVENVELETDNAEKKELPDTEDMNLQFSIFFTSNNVDVFEEILIVDEISLIGSLGGSLGLFIGFSFFGYITTLLDIIVEKMFYMLSK